MFVPPENFTMEACKFVKKLFKKKVWVIEVSFKNYNYPQNNMNSFNTDLEAIVQFADGTTMEINTCVTLKKNSA